MKLIQVNYWRFNILLGSVLIVMCFCSSANSLWNLDRNLACAVGLSTILPLDKLGLPVDRFPPVVPSGVNICDAACFGTSKCTYNWAESFAAFPFLLFRCHCPNNNVCPSPKLMYDGYLKIHCEDVSYKKNRCNKCPQGRSSYKCELHVTPKQRINPYFCICCNQKTSYSLTI